MAGWIIVKDIFAFRCIAFYPFAKLELFGTDRCCTFWEFVADSIGTAIIAILGPAPFETAIVIVISTHLDIFTVALHSAFFGTYICT